jgi:hypothetical protein
MSLVFGACTSLLPAAQLHSEDIWHKVFLHSDKLTKPFVKAHGQHLIHPSGWSTLLLLVVEAVVLLALVMVWRVEAALAVY